MAIDREGQLKRIDYGDRIFYDATLGIAGTIYPIGTPGMPSNTIADVITICVAQNINKISVIGTLTIGAGIAQDLVGHNSILTGQTAGAAYVRDFKGYLEIDAMVGGTLDIYADAADIQINANCLAGTINIYGNARVVGAGGGVTINDYTVNTKLVGWEVKDTHAHANNIVWQEVLVITTTTRMKIKNIWLDFVNLTQNMEYRLSYKIDEATYRIFDSNAASPWTPALDDGVLIYCDFIISSDFKLELKSAVVEGAIRNIPYEVDGEDME